MLQHFFRILCFVLFTSNLAIACVTLSCQQSNQANDKHLDCEFALRNQSLSTFEARGGVWDENKIHHLTTFLSDACPCCITNINNSTVQNTSVLFQIPNGNVSDFFVNQSGVRITIYGVAKCFPNQSGSTIFFNQNPNACLNSSLYTTTAQTTVQETTVFVTDPTTYIASSTSKPTTVLAERDTTTLQKTLQPTVVTTETTAFTAKGNFTTTESKTTLTTAAQTSTQPTVKITNESKTETTTWKTDEVISTGSTSYSTPRTTTSNEAVTSASSTMHGSTTSNTTSKWKTSTTLEEIVNNSVQVEVDELGLAREEKVVFDSGPPRNGKQSLTSFSGLRLQLLADLSEDQVGMVYSQFKLPLSTKKHAKVKIDRNQVQSVVPWPGSPVLSISAVSLVTNATVQANLSYSIILNATTTSPNPLESAINKKSNGSVVRLKKVDNLCGFFDRELNTFSTKGCSLTNKVGDTVTCFCNHTTLFAVLLSVQTYEVPAAVKILSYVMESFSIICLIVTVASLLVVRRKVRSDRTVVQINLTIALLFFHIFNVFQDAALLHKSSCELVTVMIHFFLLGTGTWMAIEAFTMLIKTTSQVLSFNKKSPKKIAYTKLGLGWGIPILIVIISTAVGFPTARYMDHEPLYDKYYKRCWVSSKQWMLVGSVIIPLSIIYFINLVIAFRMIWFVHQMRTATPSSPASGSKRSDSVIKGIDHIGASLKVFVMLLPVLGIPLIFSFLTSVEPYEASVAFMYINVILNGLQGLFLLLVYCVFGSEVREAILRKIQRFQLRYKSEESSHAHSKGTPATHSTNLPAKSTNNVI